MIEQLPLAAGAGFTQSRRRRQRSFLMAGLAILLGISVLIGWYAAIPQIPRLFTGWPAMQPLTALSLILAGAGMALQTAHRFRLAALPLLALAFIAGEGLFQYVAGRSFSLDTLLFREAVLAQAGDPYPGRMRLMNAVGMLLFCLCIALPRRRPRQYRRVALLASAGLVFPFVTLCSYLLGAQGFSGMAGFVALSAPAAVGQVLLFGSIVQAQRGQTWLALLYTRSPGGRTSRRLLPVILGWPLVVGLLINQMDSTIGSAHQILALALVLIMVVLTAMVLHFARRLDREVSARRVSDAARQESEERYRIVVESASEGIITIDRDRNIVFVNTAAAKIFGYPVNELLGAKLTMLMPERPRSVFEASMTEYLSTGKRHGRWNGVEVSGRHRDGGEIPLEVSFVEIRQGGQRFFTGIFHDISERKQAEARLRQLNESLEQRVKLRTADLSRANEALMQSNQELQRFAYIASHDLQTPLRSISGFAQLLGQTYGEQLDEQAHGWIRLVIDNTRRLQNLIQGLLAYSSADSQANPFEATDLRQIFDEVVAGLEIPLREAGAEVQCGSLPVVFGDRIQLGQVFQNLIDNAIKYHGSEPPRIEVSAKRQGDEWVFSVRDNGIGIAAKHLDRIFQVFRRLHTHHAFPGTGIGLAICRRVIQRHGGRIWVESEPGKGSVFYFTLPVMATENRWL